MDVRKENGVWVEEPSGISIARSVACTAMQALGHEATDFKLRDRVIVSISQKIDEAMDAACQEMVRPYGLCFHCGAKCVRRERRLGGNDTCEMGHVYPSSSALTAKSFQNPQQVPNDE